MKNLFTPDDFNHLFIREAVTSFNIADIANAKLDKLIESWPVVYGFGETAGASSLWNMNGPSKERVVHTHTARLAFIEELPKEPCKHEPSTDIEINNLIRNSKTTNWRFDDSKLSHYCMKCGVELVATWSEKK